MCFILTRFLSYFPKPWARKLDNMMDACCARAEVCMDSTVRVTGPLYIALAVSLIGGVILVGVFTILPAVCDPWSLQGALHMSLTAWVSYNILFNYYYCIRTDPGSTPDLLEVSSDAMREYGLRGATGGSPFSPGSLTGMEVRWCKMCRKPKPPMSHHCHVCNRCILKMDHHCPWMHNCIGFHNYRYFFLFLTYLWVGCAYATLMSAMPLFGAHKGGAAELDAWVVFTFVLALSVFCALSALLFWHVYLVCTAQTTIDFYQNRQAKRDARKLGEVWQNEYNLGAKLNVMSTFEVSGPWWCCVLLLPRTARLKGDGVHFLTRSRSSSGSGAGQGRGQEQTAFHSGNSFQGGVAAGGARHEGKQSSSRGAQAYGSLHVDVDGAGGSGSSGGSTGGVVTATGLRTGQSRERVGVLEPGARGPNLV